MIHLKYVMPIKRRHGRTAYYYRRDGKTVPIKGERDTQEFFESYAKIHASFESDGKPLPPAETFAGLIMAYYTSPTYEELGDRAKHEYRYYLERYRQKWGAMRTDAIDQDVIRVKVRDALKDKKSTAAKIMRILNLLFAWGISEYGLKANPVAGLRKPSVKTEGWRPWEDGEIEQARKELRGPCRTAFFLALYTGQRIGDVLAMTWPKIHDGCIDVVQEKTGEELTIPLVPGLLAELATIKKKGFFIVSRADGQNYTADGFNSMWQREKNRVGLSEVQLHGLRKNATITLIEAGCSEDEVMAVTGHRTTVMVRHYGRKARKKVLARQAMDKVGEVKK